MDDLYNLIEEFESMAGPSSEGPPPFPALDLESLLDDSKEKFKNEPPNSPSSTPASPTSSSATLEIQDSDYAAGGDMKPVTAGRALEFSEVVDVSKRRDKIEKELSAFDTIKPVRLMPPSTPPPIQKVDYGQPPEKAKLVPRAFPKTGERFVLTMSLVDESTKKIEVSELFTIYDVMVHYAVKLTLWQVDFFSIAEVVPNGYDKWLHPDMTVGHYKLNSSSRLVMRIKYFKIPKQLVDPFAMRLFYLQIQTNIVKGNYPCTDKMAIRLASLQMQIQNGDFTPGKHRPGYIGKDHIREYLSPSVVDGSSVSELEERIFRLHAKLVGMKEDDAQREYLRTARELPTFGVNLFHLFEGNTKGGRPVILGTAEDGILYSPTGKTEQIEFYSFQVLGGWLMVDEGIFQLQIADRATLLFNGPEAVVSDVIELLTGYYLFLFYTGFPVPDIPIPYEPDSLPPAELYRFPEPRTGRDIFAKTRLDAFKFIYASFCRMYTIEPPSKFLSQIDAAIDEEFVLRDIDLSSCGMGERELNVLSLSLDKTAEYKPYRTIEENLFLSSLNLANNRLNPKCAEALAKIITGKYPIQLLNLDNNELGLQTAKNLELAFRKNFSLSELSMANNKLLNKGVVIILKALKENPNLTSLNFTNNCLTSEFCALLDSMLQQNRIATSMSFGNNNFGDSGAKLIAHGLTFNKTLDSFDIHNCNMGHKALGPIVNWVITTDSVKSFNVSDNDVGGKTGKKLAQYLLEKAEKNPLNALYLARTKLGGSVSFIIQALVKNNSLRILDLSGNQIDKKSAELLAHGLEINKCLVNLTIADCLQESGLQPVIEALRTTNRTVRKLNISYTSLSVPYIKILLESIRLNGRIVDLDLSGCLNNDGCKEFWDQFKNNNTIRVLHFNANKMGRLGWRAMSQALTTNTTLQELYVRDTACDHHLIVNFAKEIEGKNTTLKKIDVTGNKIEEFATKIEPQVHKMLLAKVIFEETEDKTKKKKKKKNK